MKCPAMRARQRGVALLAVSLLLVVVGALAFMMSRQGAMAANAANAQYDTERARYLAEAGLNVAKWRDQQAGCRRNDTLVNPSRIDASGTYSAVIDNGDKKYTIDAVGTTDAGARVAISRKDVVAHDNPIDKPVASESGEDTFVNSAAPPEAPQHSLRYLELTQGSAHALLKFQLSGELSNAIIVKAELTLTQSQSNSILPNQIVSVHRMTRSGDAVQATWISAGSLEPWSKAGADYTPGNVAATTINGNATYSWDVTALVDGWVNGAFTNHGLLLRADGPLQQARFYGFRSTGGSKPALKVYFYKAC